MTSEAAQMKRTRLRFRGSYPHPTVYLIVYSSYIYVVGMSGCGKSTLVKWFLQRLGAPKSEVRNRIRMHVGSRSVVIGPYDRIGRVGLDRIGYMARPMIERYINNSNHKLYVFEGGGTKVFNPNFFRFLRRMQKKGHRVFVFQLNTTKRVCDRRRAKRERRLAKIITLKYPPAAWTNYSKFHLCMLDCIPKLSSTMVKRLLLRVSR